MKTIYSLIIVMLFAFNIASAQITKVELQAAGLTCSMCSRSVDMQLRTLDFIDSIGIDLSHATFFLFFKKDKIVDFDQIKKKVEDAGFSVALLKVNYQFDNLKVENNSSFTYHNSTFYVINSTQKILNGLVDFKIVDKGFVSDKEYKKYSKQINGTVLAKSTYHIIL
jgi:copper chaperone CopZ